MVHNGFTMNTSDSYVYSKLVGSSCEIILLYVDDMLIFSTNMDVVNETKKLLSSSLEMKDMGEADMI